MHRTLEDLDAGLAAVRESPHDHGTLELIACRPTVGDRAVLDVAALDFASGLVGDNWSIRASKRPDGWPDPDRQLTLINVRAIALIAGERERWVLAGDQLYVDLDLALANVPAGTKLQIGEAVLEVTPPPHTGCAKFCARFGSDALRWVSTPAGRALNLRGVNARVVLPGQIRRGDSIRKL